MMLSTGSIAMLVFGFVILYGGLGFCLRIALQKEYFKSKEE
ncbi:MetS family NSS transporter small subunit [Methanosarcina horonobensis]|nr:MetS family NSS transporter small subunit [Methanosarcina horonobensis]